MRRNLRRERRLAQLDGKEFPEPLLNIPHTLEAFVRPGVLSKTSVNEGKEKMKQTEREGASDFGLVKMFAEGEDVAQLRIDLKDLSICAIGEDTGAASLPYPSRGKPLSNWTMGDQPDRFPQK